MALNIKDERTDGAVRDLARETGEPITTAIRIAVDERLARVRARKTLRTDPTDLPEIIARGRARLVVDSRSPEQIIGYDADGLPS